MTTQLADPVPTYAAPAAQTPCLLRLTECSVELDGHDLPLASAGPAVIVTPRDVLSNRSTDTEFLDRLSQFIDGQHPEYLLIDLSGCEFVTSSTLGGFVRLARQLEAIGSQLCICHMSSSVSDDMWVTQLNRVLAIRNTRQEALSEWLTAEDEALVSP